LAGLREFRARPDVARRAVPLLRSICRILVVRQWRCSVWRCCAVGPELNLGDGSVVPSALVGFLSKRRGCRKLQEVNRPPRPAPIPSGWISGRREVYTQVPGQRMHSALPGGSVPSSSFFSHVSLSFGRRPNGAELSAAKGDSAGSNSYSQVYRFPTRIFRLNCRFRDGGFAPVLRQDLQRNSFEGAMQLIRKASGDPRWRTLSFCLIDFRLFISPRAVGIARGAARKQRIRRVQFSVEKACRTSSHPNRRRPCSCWFGRRRRDHDNAHLCR